MTLTPLQERLVNTAKRGAEDILRTGSEIVAVALAPDERGLFAAPLPTGSREKAAATLVAMARMFPTYATVTEAWVATVDKCELEGAGPCVPASLRPDRRECVVVTLVCHGRTVWVDTLEFKRDGGNVTFGKWSGMEACGGAEIPDGSVFPARDAGERN